MRHLHKLGELAEVVGADASPFSTLPSNKNSKLACPERLQRGERLRVLINLATHDHPKQPVIFIQRSRFPLMDELRAYNIPLIAGYTYLEG
jgi:hypothetical protein